ncbi:unnamed protein product [Effrenium voratum]|uniref:Calmodulin n=1 Tax=Effrenium voratum TaxID=2562239 RepID=A0AA36MSJ6_9DINO|nr:unnamed protein product [Effrenium voratum]
MKRLGRGMTGGQGQRGPGALSKCGVFSIAKDGDGSISRREFDQMLTNPTCVRTLSDVGVDVFALVDLADFIFDQQNELSFAAFMDATRLNLDSSVLAPAKTHE